MDCDSFKLKSVVKIVQQPGNDGKNNLHVVLLADDSGKGQNPPSTTQQKIHWLSYFQLKQRKMYVNSLVLNVISHVEASCPTFPLALLENLDSSGKRKHHSFAKFERQMFNEAKYGQKGIELNFLIMQISILVQNWIKSVMSLNECVDHLQLC